MRLLLATAAATLAFAGTAAAQLPDDPFTAQLVAETAAAVLMTAFLAWDPADPPQRFAELVARGFDLVGTGFA